MSVVQFSRSMNLIAGEQVSFHDAIEGSPRMTFADNRRSAVLYKPTLFDKKRICHQCSATVCHMKSKNSVLLYP